MAKIQFKIFTVILLLILSGCTTKERYIDRPVYVEVPVMVKPTIEKIEKPAFPIETISDLSTPREVVEAYYNTILIYKVYTNSLELALEPFYRK